MVFGMPEKGDKNDVKLSVKIVYNKEVAEEKYPGKNEKELNKILWDEIKELNQYKKNVERYFSYLRNVNHLGKKLTKPQIEWKYNFEKENDLL